MAKGPYLHNKPPIMAVKKGDKVKVHYTGKTTDDNVFDSSEGREPLEFEVGAGQMIPGFDKGVEGMELGEKKTNRTQSITIKRIIMPETLHQPSINIVVNHFHRTFSLCSAPIGGVCVFNMLDSIAAYLFNRPGLHRGTRQYLLSCFTDMAS